MFKVLVLGLWDVYGLSQRGLGFRVPSKAYHGSSQSQETLLGSRTQESMNTAIARSLGLRFKGPKISDGEESNGKRKRGMKWTLR